MGNIKVDIRVVEQLFPFAFIVDKSGKISNCGPSLNKIQGGAVEGNNFNDIFKIQRPSGLTFNQLYQLNNREMVVFKMLKPIANFMGQMMEIGDPHFKLCVINLIVEDADELTSLKLDFDDFAAQDPIFDYLMLLQTQRRAIRQADDANAKLVEAHKIAVKASETKSQFLANMSHELRTPMNGLLAMASVLQETELDEDQKDYVKTLVSSGEAMLALVNDILDLSKIEAGFIQLNREQIKFPDLIDEIKKTVAPIAEKKGLLLNFEIDSAVPSEFQGDRMRLRQVILNFVGNAVKFTSKGQVELKGNMLDQKTLQIKIRDTGIGMGPDVLSKIFSPFVQGDSSMTKKFEGTGLGLSICKKLIEAMEGKIDVESKVGEGTVFTFTIQI